MAILLGASWCAIRVTSDALECWHLEVETVKIREILNESEEPEQSNCVYAGLERGRAFVAFDVVGSEINSSGISLGKCRR